MKKNMTVGKSGVPINYLFNSNTYGGEFFLSVRSLLSASIFCVTTKTNGALLLKDEVFSVFISI